MTIRIRRRWRRRIRGFALALVITLVALPLYLALRPSPDSDQSRASEQAIELPATTRAESGSSTQLIAALASFGFGFAVLGVATTKRVAKRHQTPTLSAKRLHRIDDDT